MPFVSSLGKQRSRGRAHVSTQRSPLTRPSPLGRPDGPGHALRWVGTQIRAACYQRSVRRCGDQTNTIPLGQSSYAAYQRASPCTLGSKKCIWLPTTEMQSRTHAHTHTRTVQDSCMRRRWLKSCAQTKIGGAAESKHAHMDTHTQHAAAHAKANTQHGDARCP